MVSVSSGGGKSGKHLLYFTGLGEEEELSERFTSLWDGEGGGGGISQFTLGVKD